MQGDEGGGVDGDCEAALGALEVVEGGDDCLFDGFDYEGGLGGLEFIAFAVALGQMRRWYPFQRGGAQDQAEQAGHYEAELDVVGGYDSDPGDVRIAGYPWDRATQMVKASIEAGSRKHGVSDFQMIDSARRRYAVA